MRRPPKLNELHSVRDTTAGERQTMGRDLHQVKPRLQENKEALINGPRRVRPPRMKAFSFTLHLR
jgi:hypothetical protein